MTGLGLVTLWLAFSIGPAEHSSAAQGEARLSESLLESRWELCDSSPGQKKGCEAALRYLEEISGPQRAPSSQRKHQQKNPQARYGALKASLQKQAIPEEEWVAGALNAWLLALDAHAKLAHADESDRRASAEKIFVQGAGAKLRFHRGKVFVGYTMEDSAAEQAGLRAGDRILALNGKELGRMSETARRRWLSQTKAPYQIRLWRDGAEKNLVVREKRYYLANVEGRVRTDSRGRREGLLRVRSFDKGNTCADLAQAIEAVVAEKVSRLRLDLNNNPGGLVREAQCAASLFLGKGKVFARLRPLVNPEAQKLIPGVLAGASYGDESETTLLTESAALTRLPLIIEINQNSASAAEMLAAALQDNGRATVTGTRSFGKGSMQSVFHPWADRSLYLTRTTHLIVRPSGKILQFEGVKPNLVARSLEGENFPRERELTL